MIRLKIILLENFDISEHCLRNPVNTHTHEKKIMDFHRYLIFNDYLWCKAKKYSFVYNALTV